MDEDQDDVLAHLDALVEDLLRRIQAATPDELPDLLDQARAVSRDVLAATARRMGDRYQD